MKHFFSFFIFTLSLGLNAQVSNCFEIESILVDACAPSSQEGLNEMVRFQVGPTDLDASLLNVVWATTANSWDGVCQSAQTANTVTALNATIQGCGVLLEPENLILPANSSVILVSSVDMDATSNSFLGLSDTLYIIFHCGSNSTGNFANYNSAGGPRTLNMSFSAPAGCNDIVTYDRGLLVNGSGLPGSADGATVNFEADGTASYVNNGCIAPFNPVVADWNAPATICSSDSPLDLDALIISGPGGSWSGIGVTGNMFDPSGLTGTVSITYEVQIASCLLTSTKEIQVVNGGLATWTSPGTLCSSSAAISLVPFITGDLGGTFSGQGVSGDQFNPSGLLGDISITYSVGAGACLSADIQVITVTDGPDLSWSFSSESICSDASGFSLDALVTGTAGGTWAGPGVDQGIFNPAGLNGEIIVTYALAIGDCSGEQSDTIIVVPPPSADWNVPNFICTTQGDFDLDALVSGTTGGTWSGDFVSGSTFNSDGFGGTYPITYTIGDQSCGDVSTQLLVVLPAPAAPTIIGSPNYCQGQVLPTFTSSEGPSTTWYSDSLLTNELAVSESFQVTDDSISTYYATTFSGGCLSETAEVTLNLILPIELELSSSDSLAICPNESLTLYATTNGNITWANGSTGSEIQVSEPGTYLVTAAGFCNTIEDSITVDDAHVEVDLSVSTNQGPATLNVTVNSNSLGSDFCIYTLNGIETSLSSSNTLTLSEEGTYVLTYRCENSAGCFAEQSSTIEVLSGVVKLDFPNSFTPNGDGMNDLFKAQYSALTELDVVLFNRWGEQVASFQGLAGSWDGESSNGQVPDGVYFYIAHAVDYYGVKLDRKGSVTLLRK